MRSLRWTKNESHNYSSAPGSRGTEKSKGKLPSHKRANIGGKDGKEKKADANALNFTSLNHFQKNNPFVQQHIVVGSFGNINPLR